MQAFKCDVSGKTYDGAPKPCEVAVTPTLKFGITVWAKGVTGWIQGDIGPDAAAELAKLLAPLGKK
jgi:hypothetical protein